jgi:hypothetical protein
MSLSRRGFLGSVAASCLGLTGAARADLRGAVRDRNRRRIDEAQARYGGPVTGTGFLDQPAYALDDDPRPPQVPYDPQPGDLMFSISRYFIYRAGHTLSGAGEPSHSGVIYRRPDGSLAALEAGPFDIPLIRSMDLIPYVSAYNNRGRVWIRTRCAPLTDEQSCRLTEFALRQENKPFARARLYAQITPLRSRGPVRTEWLGGPHGPDRVSYYCAELCAESIVYAGLIAPEDARPSATYPRELFFEDSRIPFLNRHFKLGRAGWNPPARWRPHPCEGGCEAGP